MVVECPRCHSKFRLEDSFVDRTEVKLRCGVCSHVFKFNPSEEIPLAREIEEAKAATEKEQTSGTEQEKKDSEAGKQKEHVEPGSVIKEIDSILGSGEEAVVPGGAESEPALAQGESKQRSKKWLWISLGAIILILGGLWFAWTSGLITGLQIHKKDSGIQGLERGPYFTIPKESVNYELLNNAKEGQVLVIKGVINRLTSRPVRSVLVEARVFNAKGELIGRSTAYAGIVPDVSVFAKQGRDDIQMLLNSEPVRMNILASSVNIPFIIPVFGKPALEGTSFKVEVKKLHWE
ncbi:MAG: zinc-ribbon domain-containing protein [Deltaproteobacteria bacterium]|nr:zinc-ribbon domain-containing protein [Deltaproteobacteria bacterium]